MNIGNPQDLNPWLSPIEQNQLLLDGAKTQVAKLTKEVENIEELKKECLETFKKEKFTSDPLAAKSKILDYQLKMMKLDDQMNTALSKTKQCLAIIAQCQKFIVVAFTELAKTDAEQPKTIQNEIKKIE